MEIILRDWQKQAYDELKKNNFKGILKVGTGKGKTVFAIYCIKEFLKDNSDFRTCIIVPTINLMFQWRKEILKFLDVEESDVSLFYGQEKDILGKIVIYVVNSAINDSNLEKAHLSRPFNFMVADECHHYGSNLFSRIFKTRIEKVIGLSATPERERDNEGTGKIIEGIGPKVFELNHLDDPNAIPPFVIWSILVPFTYKEKQEYEENSFKILKLNRYFLSKFGIRPEDDDYGDKIKKLADKKNPAALKLLSLWSKQSGIKYQAKNKISLVKQIIELESESKIIIFNERIKFTEKLYEELRREFSLNFFLIHSGLSKSEIQKRLDEFKNVKKGVLISPKLIDEGYDVPDASVGIVVSFTRSARQMIQRDGRILRKTNEYKKATRYSLIIEDVEEEKYFQVLRNANMASKAIEGEWLKFNPERNIFSEAQEFKQNFINFGIIKKYHKDQFKEWVIKKLDYYEENLKKRDVEEIEKRMEFFSRFIDVIDSLSEEHPNRWNNLKEKLKRNVSKKVRYQHQVPHKEREILKEELRKANTRLVLPQEVFDVIIRFIENEPFELTEMAKEYIETLTEGEKPNIWPEKIYNLVKELKRKFS